MPTATLEEPDTSESLELEEVVYVSEEKYRKRLIETFQRNIETLRHMKQEEAEQGISNGRRKWFNREIDRLRENIQRLDKGEKQ